MGDEAAWSQYYSEMGQSELSSMSGTVITVGEQEQSNTRSVVLIAVFLFLLIFGGLAIFFITSSSGGDDSATDAGADQGIGGPSTGGGQTGGPSTFQPPLIIPSPPYPVSTSPVSTSPVSTSPVSTSPVSTSPVSTSPVSTYPVSTYAPPVFKGGVRRILVCTIGPTAVLEKMVPPDGLCDFIYFMEVIYDDANKNIRPSMGSIAFEVIKKAASHYRQTTFGTSLEVTSAEHIAGETDKQVAHALKELHASKLFHFGCLNVDGSSSSDAHIRFLRRAVDFVLTNSTAPIPVQVALGIGLLNNTHAGRLLPSAKDAIRRVPGITQIIINVHVNKITNLGQAYPCGPNPDMRIRQTYNIMTLAEIEHDVKDAMEQLASATRIPLLSFGMYARAFRMPDTWNAPAVRNLQAKGVIMADYARVCKGSPKDEITSDANARFVADTSRHFLSVFDDVKSFEEKVLRRLTIMPDNNAGFALFHVEMDDFSGYCGDPFARVKAIRNSFMP